MMGVTVSDKNGNDEDRNGCLSPNMWRVLAFRAHFFLFITKIYLNIGLEDEKM